MRTNIVINDELMEEAFKCGGGLTTKRKIVETALSEYINNRKRKDIRELRGKIHFRQGYNYKKMREGI